MARVAFPLHEDNDWPEGRSCPGASSPQEFCANAGRVVRTLAASSVGTSIVVRCDIR
jgi:hypothetical protein